MLAIKWAPADHDTQTCRLRIKFRFDIFHERYIVAISDTGVDYYLRTRHRCDREQLLWLFMNSGSQKKFMDKFLSFNLGKVR